MFRPEPRPDAKALIHHGLGFVEDAVATLTESVDSRSLRYAVLHLAIGVELLLKARLFIEHWTLVFDHPGRARESDLRDGSFVSVRPAELVNRLQNICGVPLEKRHQRALSDLRESRNRVTHFVPTVSVHEAKVQAVRVLSFLRDFASAELPLLDEQKARFSELAASLHSLEVFIEERWADIRARVDDLQPLAFRCPRCRESAGAVDGEGHQLLCLFCLQASDAADAADEHLESVLGVSQYQVLRDGDFWPKTFCPEGCPTEAFVRLDEPPTQHICFHCGVVYPSRDLGFCDDCGQPCVDDESGPFCYECYQTRVSKD